MEMSEKIDLDKLVKASGLKVTPTQLVELIVEQYTMSQAELVDRFHFSNQRISNLRERKLLREVKKGLYLREEVENMRAEQISGKRLEKYGSYKLMPAYDNYFNNLIIDKLRVFDCLTCVRVNSREKNYNPEKDEYNIHLKEVLNAVQIAFSKGKRIYLFEHQAFQDVRKEDDIQKVIDLDMHWTKEYSVSEFLYFLQQPASEYLGWPEVMNYSSVIKELTTLSLQDSNK